MKSNVITDNRATSAGGGLCLYADGAVVGNTITGNSVSQSSIAEGPGVYLWAYSWSDCDFLYNTVVGNFADSPSATTGAVSVGSAACELHYNNLYGNHPYDVGIQSRDDISGTNNYWGTVTSVDIVEQVYDWYDDSDRGKLLYIPYLQEPSTDAPFPPPTGLSVGVDGESATLSWDAHPSFTTGYGYKVYYDTDSSLPPYEGTGLNEGDAPIDVGDQTTYTLTGLDPSKDYYFSVTAYDNEGHESWYSNVAWKKGGYWVYLPAVLRQ